MALYEIKEEKERVILVGVSTRENDDTEDSLDELKDLVKSKSMTYEIAPALSWTIFSGGQ